MDEKKALSLLKKYGQDKWGYSHVLEHSKAVQKLAVQWAKKIKSNGYKVDVEFVSSASLLHDIGRFRYAPGTPDMIRHGVEGAKILKKEGYPLYARLAERHIGAGITKADVKKQGLPIPVKDYSPKTIEEKIVACADNLLEGSEKRTIQATAKSFEEKLGEPYGKRAVKLYKEIEKMLKGKR
jgi:uncharacterized protein